MRVAVVLCLSALAAAASAAPRDSRHRETLLELAAVLGESHALRQACAGAEDQFWRARMLRLLEVEAAPPAFEGRLKSAFNAAYAAGRDDFASCSPAARRAEAAAAARGRLLSVRLAQAAGGAAPVGVAEPPDAR